MAAKKSASKPKKPEPNVVAAAKLIDAFGPSAAIAGLATALRAYGKRLAKTDCCAGMHRTKLETTGAAYAATADEIENGLNLLPAPEPKRTITRSELARMSTTNSPKIPRTVNDGGVRKEYVGIGWVAAGAARGSEEALVVEQHTDRSPPRGFLTKRDVP